MLTSLFSETTSSISIVTILICSIVSILLGVVIAFTHMKTNDKYSKEFLITLSVLPVLVEIVMIMVNGNLGTSIAIVGAFNLVRFRSMPGTSKEILAVFYAMAIGLATGMGHVFFAALSVLIVSLTLIILTKTKIFDNKNKKQILKITVPENLDYTNMFDDEFKKYTESYELRKSKTTNMGSLFELTYNVTLKDNVNEKKFIDELRIKNCNLKILLSHEIEEEML